MVRILSLLFSVTVLGLPSLALLYLSLKKLFVLGLRNEVLFILAWMLAMTIALIIVAIGTMLLQNIIKTTPPVWVVSFMANMIFTAVYVTQWSLKRLN